jgi:hypothetical protein
MALRGFAAAIFVIASVTWSQTRQQHPVEQQTPPPPPVQVVTQPGQPVPPGARTPPKPPALPIDAQRIMDQFRQQEADLRRGIEAVLAAPRQSLIQQLESLQAAYATAGRAEDAVAVRAHIRILQQEAGEAVTATQAPLTRERISMTSYRDRVGQSFTFEVTGSADLPVYGTGIYTDDSPIEGAAVHAGVLRSGQTGIVKVTVLPGLEQYVGSRRNGMESGTFGRHGGSFRVELGSARSSRPTSIEAFRGRIGEAVVVPVTGATTGSVWGTNIYTDDSSLGAAAVHAGVLRANEFSFVRVTLEGGLSSYQGSTRNGVASQDYAEWQGSFRIERAPQPWTLTLPADVEDATGMVSLVSLRAYPGVSFSLLVTGSTGTLRGSDVYTDDSAIGAAAVHAGLLRLGERGYVRVTILPGQQSYAGSEQNGIKSSSAENWLGSFSVGPGTRPR